MKINSIKTSKGGEETEIKFTLVEVWFRQYIRRLIHLSGHPEGRQIKINKHFKIQQLHSNIQSGC